MKDGFLFTVCSFPLLCSELGEEVNTLRVAVCLYDCPSLKLVLMMHQSKLPRSY